MITEDSALYVSNGILYCSNAKMVPKITQTNRGSISLYNQWRITNKGKVELNETNCYIVPSGFIPKRNSMTAELIVGKTITDSTNAGDMEVVNEDGVNYIKIQTDKIPTGKKNNTAVDYLYLDLTTTDRKSVV